VRWAGGEGFVAFARREERWDVIWLSGAVGGSEGSDGVRRPCFGSAVCQRATTSGLEQGRRT
jgi:hypothetical protein